MSYANGVIIGVANTPTQSVASGIWSLSAVALAVKGGIWPVSKYTVIQTFTANST